MTEVDDRESVRILIIDDDAAQLLIARKALEQAGFMVEEGDSAERDTAELEAGGFLLDQKALDNIRAVQQEGAPNLLDRIIKIYFENSPKLLQALHDAVVKDNAPDTMGQAAHSLKSSSANLGATGLAALCREIEDMARENRTAGAGAILDEIEKLYPLVCESLAAECENAVG